MHIFSAPNSFRKYIIKVPSTGMVINRTSLFQAWNSIHKINFCFSHKHHIHFLLIYSNHIPYIYQIDSYSIHVQSQKVRFDILLPLPYDLLSIQHSGLKTQVHLHLRIWNTIKTAYCTFSVLMIKIVQIFFMGFLHFRHLETIFCADLPHKNSLIT